MYSRLGFGFLLNIFQNLKYNPGKENNIFDFDLEYSNLKTFCIYMKTERVGSVEKAGK